MKAFKIVGLATLMALSTALAQEADPAAEAEATPEMSEASSLWASGSIDVSSGYICDSGEVLSDALAIQPWFGFGFDAFGKIPLEFSAWANYATDRISEDQTQKHCFNEVDLSIGTTFKNDTGTAASLSLVTWQYPNMAGWNGEELLFGSLSQTVGVLTLGLELEYMLTGDCDNDLHIIPFAEIGFDITDDVSVALYGQLYYNYGEGESIDAWTAYNVMATISAFDFSIYAAYWGQISDKIYTDEEHDVENTVYGISYSFEL
ncbi:MAG: hypothetical protein ACOX9C_04600 [Kiritimatiellia bacterium]|jgi:hypothetical protein|uniref:hypothetical protein n=1 Tax=Atribacter sp. TaxID=2847780 RepID=UPI003D986122